MSKAKKKTDRQVALEIAREYIESCQKIGLPIKRALLFGSYAKGKPNPHSDIDLLLVSDKFVNNTLHNWKFLAPVTAHLYQVEPHPYPMKNFFAVDSFADEVKGTGIEIEL